MSELDCKAAGYRQYSHAFAVYLDKPRPTISKLDSSFADLFAFLDRSILRWADPMTVRGIA
jgi:hypothetical protein